MGKTAEGMTAGKQTKAAIKREKQVSKKTWLLKMNR